MLRVALVVVRIACVAALYWFLYRVCRALVRDASLECAYDPSDGCTPTDDGSALVPDASVDDSI